MHGKSWCTGGARKKGKRVVGKERADSAMQLLCVDPVSAASQEVAGNLSRAPTKHCVQPDNTRASDQ